MSEQNTTQQSDTKFIKVERKQFDDVLRVGTREFIEQVPSLSMDQLRRAERWVDDLRKQKDAKTYLTFPVSKEKQQAAGRLYLQALSGFRTAVRTELAKRAVSMFNEPVAEADAEVEALAEAGA
jgi:hypothetical protein